MLTRATKPCFHFYIHKIQNNVMPSLWPVKHYCEKNRDDIDAFNELPSVKNYQLVKIGNLSPPRKVPRHITVPRFGIFSTPRSIDRKTGLQLEKMRESCHLARKVLNTLGEQMKVGMTTDEIDKLAHEVIVANNAYPSPLFYRGFPKSICTSVNNVACHGIPDDRPLEDGDMITVDVTVYYSGYHGDCAETYAVGNVDESGKLLIKAAKQCRDAAISACSPGKPFSVIGKTVSSLAESFGFQVMPAFCGHGIGRYFHGLPDVYHFDNDFRGTMEEGMTFTVEPVISEGSQEAVLLEDGWTAVTLDNSRAAQFEHTILITEDGVEVLTQ